MLPLIHESSTTLVETAIHDEEVMERKYIYTYSMHYFHLFDALFPYLSPFVLGHGANLW